MCVCVGEGGGWAGEGYRRWKEEVSFENLNQKRVIVMCVCACQGVLKSTKGMPIF